MCLFIDSILNFYEFEIWNLLYQNQAPDIIINLLYRRASKTKDFLNCQLQNL